MQGKTPFWHQQSANRDEKGRRRSIAETQSTALLNKSTRLNSVGDTLDTTSYWASAWECACTSNLSPQHAQVLLIRLWITWKHGLAMEQLACRSYSNLKIAIRICRMGATNMVSTNLLLFSGAWNSSHPIQESVEQVAAAALAATQDRMRMCVCKVSCVHNHYYIPTRTDHVRIMNEIK
jgi:hypothetical protein